MGHVRSLLLEGGQGRNLDGFVGRGRRVLAAVLPLTRVKTARWWRIRQHCECRVEFGRDVVVGVDVELPHLEGRCWSMWFRDWVLAVSVFHASRDAARKERTSRSASQAAGRVRKF